MTKKEKLLKKFRENPKNIRFDDLETLLKQFQFNKVKTNAGSHFKWINHEKNLTFAAPRKNPVKRIYIKLLLHLITENFKND